MCGRIIFVCVVHVHLRAPLRVDEHSRSAIEMRIVASQCVFSLHRRRFRLGCVLSAQEGWCECTVQYPSLLYSLYGRHHSFCGSILIKGTKGTACDKAISIVPVPSSFIRL